MLNENKITLKICGKKTFSAHTLVKISLLSAIGFILTLPMFRWSLPIFPGFLSMDFSDMPALIGAVVLGPIPAVWIMAIKNIMDVVLTGSSSAGIGPLANFIVGTAYVFPLGFVYHRMNRSNKALVAGAAVGTATATVIASLLNLTILIPAYAFVLDIPIDVIVGMGNAINPAITNVLTLVIFSIVPFNIFKFGLVSIAGVIFYKAFKPALAYMGRL